MQVLELIERFLGHHARHHKPPTVRYYRLGLAWLRKGFAAIDWSQLERDQLIAALDAANINPKHGTAWKSDTIRRNILAFEQLQKFAIDQFDADPILRPRDLKKPPGNKREDIPSEKEIEQIFQAAGEKSAALELALKSLAQSGMRPNELCRARICELNPARDLLVLADHKTKGKTGQSKRVPFGPSLKGLVEIAIGERKQGPIWLDENCKAWTVGKLSTAFRLVKTALGINQKLVLYSLRHYKGTEVARKHGIHAAMKILGHRQITTTQRYAHPNDEDARRWQE